MKLGSTVKARFPKFAYYIEKDIPKLMSSKVIIRAIERHSGYTGGAVIHALKFGYGPKVKVIENLRCGAWADGSPIRAYGCYKGANIIEIDAGLVRAFERGTDKRTTASGSRVSVAGVTLLHELTHWADNLDGIDDPLPAQVGTQMGVGGSEEGIAFEHEVYGKIINL